jgi:hypothetical protein
LWAAERTVNLTDTNLIESSSLVINSQLGGVHPPLQVLNYNNPNTLTVEVGDGRHGPFNINTYAQFSVNGDLTGNRITLDVNEFPVLQVTDFTLEQGWILEVEGDGPLIIYSLSDVKILGEIWCHGEDGQDATGSTAGAGGRGRCGGADGGSGGAPGADGTDGFDVSTAVTGGQGGNGGGAAVSGGGGGSWNTTTPPGAGTNASMAGGSEGDSLTDPEFTTIAGGAGGGGGSGSLTDAGAGGGGGGGGVIIHAVNDFHLGEEPSSNYGRILASGGRGGDSDAAGGAGGGGGGGSVRILVGGNIEMLNTLGVGAGVANLGAGGSNVPTDSGGNGGPGRNWYSSTLGGYNTILGVGGGYYTPPEETIAPGDVQFVQTPQQVETRSLDLRNTRPQVLAVSTVPESSDFAVEFKGSEDDFQEDDTGWTTDVSALAGKRFLKVRVIVTNSSPASPTLLTGLQVRYTPGILSEYEFTATSCAHVNWPTSRKGSFFLLLPLLLTLHLRKRIA